MPPRPASPAPGSWTTVEPPPGGSTGYGAGYTPSFSRTTYQATAEQLERDKARRRYLGRYVYTPVIIAVILVLILFVLVIFLAFGVNTPAALSFIAGMAGLVVILMSIPLIILMTILPITWLALRLNRRQQRQLYPETGPMAYRSRIQILLWQLDSLLAQAQRQAERGGDALARPLMKLHAMGDYIRGFGRGLNKNFTRSETHESE